VDVSALSRVQQLDLSGCTGVRDFAAVPHARRRSRSPDFG